MLQNLKIMIFYEFSDILMSQVKRYFPDIYEQPRSIWPYAPFTAQQNAFFNQNECTVFDLIKAHTPICVQSSNFNSLQITISVLFVYFYKGICCGYPFELHRLVNAIRMSTNNKCFSRENQKIRKKTTQRHRISIIWCPSLIFFFKKYR